MKARLRSVLERARSRREAAPVSEQFAAAVAPRLPTTPPGPTIALINDCRDQENFGAQALMDGLLALLGAAAPNAEIHPLPSHWLIEAPQGYGAFVDGGRGMRAPAVHYPALADQFESVAAEWEAGRGGPDVEVILRRLAGADLVVLNGEGSIYRTNVSAVRELFLAWFAKTSLGKPTVFVNGTVHLTDVVPILPAMVRKTFAAIDAVAVREPKSLRNLAQHAPDTAVALFPDSAFALSESVAVKHPPRLVDGPFFLFDPGAMPMDDRYGTASALHELVNGLQQIGGRALFVSSAPADAYIEAIAQATGGAYVGTLLDYREWMGVAKDAAFLVSGRYHNPILAAIVGCPSIAFGSTNHKVHGACEMLDGHIGSPFDGTDIRTQLRDILSRAEQYTADRAGLGARLKQTCARRRAEVDALGEFVLGAL